MNTNVYNSSLLLIKKYGVVLIIIGFILFMIGIFNTFYINNKNYNNIIYNNLNKKNTDNINKYKILKNFNEYSYFYKKSFNKIKNRPWAALYTSTLYFTGISLGVMFFLSIQHISQAGWIIIITRIMESIISFLPYGGVIILLILIFNMIGLINMFEWMDIIYDKNIYKYDKILFYKEPFLNKYFYIIRSFIYIIGWTFFYIKIKNISKKLDITNKIFYQNKLYNISVKFVIFFAITSMVMSWDWIMSLDPHWFSTLFGWYVLSSYLVSSIAIIIIITVYLHSKNIIKYFNTNHLHDLSKYLFATSLLWSYLWFAQFLLYWYGNIPEEVIYFIERSNKYKNIHFWMLIPNFVIPFFGLISSNSKRKLKTVCIISIIILIGHYIDMYNMIMPSTVGSFYGFGFPEIGSLMFIIGIFIYVIFNTLSSINLYAKGNKFFNESKYFNTYH